MLVLLLSSGLGACSQASKKPLTKQTYDYLVGTSHAVQNDDWSQASNSLDGLKSAWKKAKPMIQLNQSTQAVEDFESSLSRLESFIQNQDKAESQAELNNMMTIWKLFKD